VVRLDNVSKRYGERVALHPLSLEFARGETTALIGPSGCGKSTLLRMIVGLVSPDTGAVCIDGEAMSAGNADVLRHRIGYVIQEGGLFPHLTCARNVALLARYLGWSESRIGERVEALRAIVDIPPDTLARYPQQLSGGQRQRVGLMRALMLDPGVLLLDEPLGALDPIVRAALQKDLRDVFEKLRKSVLVVTHDMAEAAYLADSIAVMREGAVLQRGTMKELVDHPAHPFVAEFVGAQRSLAEALR
jgi:osmoprotectant transport system ATP-binding protein